MADQNDIKTTDLTQADKLAIREIAEVLTNGSDFIRGKVIGYAEAYRDMGKQVSA